MTNETDITFESVKERLDEIVDAVNDESISLDDALDLYEEAVKLGMQASTLLEEGIAQQDAESETSEDDGEIANVEADDEVAGEALGDSSEEALDFDEGQSVPDGIEASTAVGEQADGASSQW